MLSERYRKIESVTKYSNYYLGKCYTWLSTPITERAAAWGFHPNALTLLSLVAAGAGCFLVAAGARHSVMYGAILLYLSYVLDWCDGQLARFTQKVSPFGGWLDQICDRVKETAYVFAAAYGVMRQTADTTIWVWAFLALFFLFLLEYYSQMSRAIPEPEQQSIPSIGNPSASQMVSAGAAPARRVVIDFSIDEQYFVLVAGLLIVGSRRTLMLIVVLAGLMAVYKPLKGWTRYYRNQRSVES